MAVTHLYYGKFDDQQRKIRSIFVFQKKANLKHFKLNSKYIEIKFRFAAYP